jgi:hypothetical protein
MNCKIGKAPRSSARPYLGVRLAWGWAAIPGFVVEVVERKGD